MYKKILVVDDEESIRKSFVLALEDTDYEVDTAESGMDGVKKVKNQKYDLIYMDLKMPGMNGVEALKAMRKIDSSVIVYFVTAFYGEFFDVLENAQNEGLSFDVLRKPVGMDDILAVTNGILKGALSHQ